MAARRYRGASPEQRRAQRRQKLIEAGIGVFGSHGFHAATVRQICAEAGLTERYFYESFENQQALFGAVYDHLLDRTRERIFAALAGAPREVEALARAGLHAYFETLQREPHTARVLLIEVYGTTRDLDRLYRRGVYEFAEVVRGIIEARFPPDPSSALKPGLLATAMVGAAIHLGMRWYLGGYQESLETMVANALAFVTAMTERLRA